jgi:DNA primase
MKDNGQKKRLWIPRGLVIPYIVDNEIVRVRIRRFGDVEPRYYILPGGSSQVMILGRGKKAHVVVESELDTIMVFVKSRDLDVGAIGLGSSSTKPDSEADLDLSKSLCILNSLDFDRAGRAAYDWWKKQYARCIRWPVPEGKDPGEAFQSGVDIREWIRVGLPPAMTIAPSRLYSAREKSETRNTPTPPDPEPKKTTIPDGIPESVARLYTLLKNHPVKIRHSHRRTTIFNNPSWEQKNWGVSKEISALVFMDPDCFNHINAFPEGMITSDNFFDYNG